MKFPEQKKDLPGAREVKNSLVIDGTFDKAFEQITQMPTETGNLDAIHAILGQLVHDAVDRAFEAAQGQTGSVQALRKAFITSLVEGSSEAGRRPTYQLSLKFENAELLGQAGDELNWMLRQDVTHVLPVGTTVKTAGGHIAAELLPAGTLLGACVKLYADKRGAFQGRQLTLPEPDIHAQWEGDGQFGDWKLAGDGVGFYSADTVRRLLDLRTGWDTNSEGT